MAKIGEAMAKLAAVNEKAAKILYPDAAKSADAAASGFSPDDVFKAAGDNFSAKG